MSAEPQSGVVAGDAESAIILHERRGLLEICAHYP
ncbi:hypothetical protein SAHL_16885 [Salinisphaera orenii YIM 95161]|uniref:Uncharacterized protein n=1 Tax=Salinisphaera orenii YIM 95161 TaxID=1051139 RepID=A0A423PDI1_9GAMM|nr:hypothetical protein SAHL_16885 [Salinisphaera halophila YIM 95161]